MTNLKTLFLFPILYNSQHKQEWSLWLTQESDHEPKYFYFRGSSMFNPRTAMPWIHYSQLNFLDIYHKFLSKKENEKVTFMLPEIILYM